LTLKGDSPLYLAAPANGADSPISANLKGTVPFRLARLLRPGSVAVVGASERAGSYGGEALRNLARLGYPGRVYAVNPRHDSVHGVAAFPSLADLPEAPDAVVVAIPAAAAPDVVSQARELGCGGAVVFAAGFAEAPGGEALQRELVAAAGGLPVCGPNGNGIVSLWDRVALWGDSVAPREAGHVAVISQSGNVAVNALASRRGLGLHTVVSCGNEAVLSAADFMCALAERDGVRSIALYLEADGDGDRWCDALERCLEAGIGVAVLKAGATRAGAAAAGAHTGAVAGDHRIFRALFEEAGAAWAEDPHDLLELAKALAAPRRATAPGVAVMTCSGGDSAVAADLAADLGVPLPELSAATLDRLRAVLPASATAANPLDYTSLLWDDQAALRELVLALADDPAVGQVLVLYDDAGFEDASWAAVLEAVNRAAVVSAAPVTVASTLPELAAAGAIAGLRSGLRAVRPRPPGTVKRDRRGATSGRWLEEHAVKARLRQAGIAVPDGRVTDDAVGAWRELGGPVAVKRIGVVHKAREGGVALDLDDEAAIVAAQQRLGTPVLVERMAPPGVELLVSVKRDGFAPVLVLGLGGVWTELLDDVVVLPLPVTAAEVEAGLKRLRGAKTLEGVDTRAAAELAVKLTRTGFVLVELNPVIVHAHGALAVDALADEEVLR
jgi:acetate---CoA ligase (ADP-forming)